MKTETHLLCDKQTARELGEALIKAAENVYVGECQHVRQTLEQSSDSGPWRLIITVTNNDN